MEISTGFQKLPLRIHKIRHFKRKIIFFLVKDLATFPRGPHSSPQPNLLDPAEFQPDSHLRSLVRCGGAVSFVSFSRTGRHVALSNYLRWS